MRHPRRQAATAARPCGACPRSVAAAAFAGAVRAVVEDYLRFLLDEEGGTEAAKAFMARHAAARAALGHVETLLKLVGGGTEAPDSFQDGFVLLGQAREALGSSMPDDTEEGVPDGEPIPG